MDTIKNYEKFLKYFFYSLSLGLIILAFLVTPITKTIIGLQHIILIDDILITDYLVIGGIGGTLLNVGLVTLVTMLIISKYNISISGFTFSALLTLVGFSFFGKNIYNILPIYFGVFLYSRYMKESYKKFFTVAIFSTCLAPLIGSNFITGYVGLVVSALIGIFYGFVIVPLASHVIKFHNGYTLFNVGFAGGLFALIVSSVIRAFGIELHTARYISTQYSSQLTLLILLLCLLFLALALLTKEFTFKNYVRLLKKPGRAITDFFHLFDSGIVYFNIAIIGLFCLLITLLLGVPMNGPIFGSILTIMGFAAFGISPYNSLFVVFGCVLMFYLTTTQIETEQVMMALFVMGISPIAGQYGLVVGIIAGILHFSVVSFSASWQGALNLYNNGFASGIVAGIIVSIIDNFKRME